MSKVTDNRVRIESWNVRQDRRVKDIRKIVEKVAVRNSAGQFHGATNFRGSVLR